VVAAGIFAYFIYYRNLTLEIHDGYGTSAFDIGVFDQGTWLLSRFKNPFVTITGRNLFADHTSLIMFFFAPLYWVFPGASTLLTVQAAALAAGAIPVYLVGVRRIGAPLGCVLAIAYLLHPALGASNMENFHPDAVLALFVGMALYAAIEDKLPSSRATSTSRCSCESRSSTLNSRSPFLTTSPCITGSSVIQPETRLEKVTISPSMRASSI
jgi:uncharacterized membrane protein